MIKKKYLLLILFILIVVIKYNYNSFLKEPVLNTTMMLQSKYFDILNTISETIEEHINQKERIKKLKEEVENLKKSALLSSAFAGKLRSLLNDKSEIYSPNLDITRALSYVDLANYNRVWLDYNLKERDKIYGLLYGGYTAGIVINENGRALGILDGDDKCIFSIYIGSYKIPGVIFGDKDKMIVRYIPLWRDVQVGDEVYTSGLDDIFFEGIKVGRVTEIIKEESYKSAVVKPYAKVLVPGFFHIITDVASVKQQIATKP